MTDNHRDLDEIWSMMSDVSKLDGLAVHDTSGLSVNAAALSAWRCAVGNVGDDTWLDHPAKAGVPKARLRLYGPAVEEHTVEVRTAAKIMTTFQDLLSAVAMATRGRYALGGAVPGDIRSGTTLRLFPRPAFGSLVLEMEGPEPMSAPAEQALLSELPSTADDAATRLVGLINAAHFDDEESLLAGLRSLGPRVSTHLSRLVAFPLDESTYIDVGWQTTAGSRLAGFITADAADRLRSVMTKYRTATKRERVSGFLVTVSSEDPIALRLSSGKRISMELSEDVTPGSLTPYFQQRVTVSVDVEVVTKSSTGAEAKRYTLVSVEGIDHAAMERDLFDDLFDDLED